LIKIKSIYPILFDRFSQAGQAKDHYFFQDILAARKIYNRKPKRHVDIGSSISGFIAHLMVFMDIEVVDIRPLESSRAQFRSSF